MGEMEGAFSFWAVGPYLFTKKQAEDANPLLAR